jgi:hypothetical protein
MQKLGMASDELLAAASSWHGLSAELSGTIPPAGAGLSGQASAAAVNAVHAGVAAAGAAFAARTQITAVKTAAASTAQASTEGQLGGYPQGPDGVAVRRTR